jgi:sugar phosphate isomerase/epimerase
VLLPQPTVTDESLVRCVVVSLLDPEIADCGLSKPLAQSAIHNLQSTERTAMIFGYNTNGFAHHRLPDALMVLAQLGYGSVAVTIDHDFLDPYALDLGKRVGRIKSLLQRFGLRSVVETGARFILDPFHKHQPTLVSAGREQRQQRLDFLLNAINIAREFEADAVSFWSGTPTDAASDSELMDRLVAGCQVLCERAENYQVRLAFEPEPDMFIDTLAGFQELYERVDHPFFGLTIDIGHLHCMGETPIADRLRDWKDVLWNIHLEDMRQGVHEHLMFGDGEIEFGPVLQTLVEIGYQGGVHVELSRHCHDAVETARKALEFLKQAAGS